MDNPAGLDIGTGPTKFQRGMIIGDVAWVAAASVAAYACRRWLPKWMALCRMTAVWLRLRLPGALIPIVMLFLQPVVGASVTCLRQPAQPWLDAIIGSGGMGISAAVGCALLWATIWRSADARAIMVVSSTRSTCSCLSTLFAPRWKWRNARMGDAFVSRFGSLFEAYRRGLQWFICVEFAASFACGVIAGLMPTSNYNSIMSCASLMWGVAIVNGWMLACIVWLRPHNCLWDVILSIITCVAGVVWAVVVLTGDSQHAAAVVTLVQLLLQVVMPVVPAFITAVWRFSAWLTSPAALMNGWPSDVDGSRCLHDFRLQRQMMTDSVLRCAIPPCSQRWLVKTAVGPFKVERRWRRPKEEASVWLAEMVKLICATNSSTHTVFP